MTAPNSDRQPFVTGTSHRLNGWHLVYHTEDRDWSLWFGDGKLEAVIVSWSVTVYSIHDWEDHAESELDWAPDLHIAWPLSVEEGGAAYLAATMLEGSQQAWCAYARAVTRAPADLYEALVG